MMLFCRHRRKARDLGGTLHDLPSWKLPALALALVMLAGAGAARAATDSATPPAAEATSETTFQSGAQEVVIAPMPDEALPGAYCLAGTAAAMIAVFAVGPTEGLLLLSGAMHIPSSTAVLFIPLMSILGGSACGLAAAAQPAMGWAIEQSDNIAAQIAAAGEFIFASGAETLVDASAGTDGASRTSAVPAVRPLNEDETQSAGCIGGGLAGFAAAMSSSPTEVTMLSSGANTIVSSTPILMLGLLGSIVASGCVLGTYAILPVQAFLDNFTAIGESFYAALHQIGTAVSEGTSRTLAVLKGDPQAAKPRTPRRLAEAS